MLFRTFELISSALLLLNVVGVGHAMLNGPAPPDSNGIRILSATCRNNHYDKKEIYNAVKVGMKALREIERGEETSKVRDYYLKKYDSGSAPGESQEIPFEAPFYTVLIKSLRELGGLEGIEKATQLDKVVFTVNGRLVKVVSYVRSSDSSNDWRYENCGQQFVLVPMIPIPDQRKQGFFGRMFGGGSSRG